MESIYKYSSLEDFAKDYSFDFSNPENYLGHGSYGTVYKAKKINTIPHQEVAIKVGNDLHMEYLKAQDLSHRNIAKYLEFYQIPDKHAGKKDYLVMAFYPHGNLADYLNERVVTHEEIKQISTGILEGLNYLHSKAKRIHRDLKPSNILIYKTENGTDQVIPLITDFGLVKVVKNDDYVDGSDIELSDGRGTLTYKAPEQIEGERAHYNLDLWAFGVILYEMCLGTRPFKASLEGNTNDLLRKIKNVEIPAEIETVPEPYQTIIKKCLVKDIHQRVRKTDHLLDLVKDKDETSKRNGSEGKTDTKSTQSNYLLESRQLFIKYADSFSEDLAKVWKDDKKGFIDTDGNEIVLPLYDNVCSFSEGLAGVKKNGKWGFIDKNGNQKIPFLYDDLYFHFSNGLVAVKLLGKWRFINKDGNQAIPFAYDFATKFKDGLALVGEQKGLWAALMNQMKCGYIDKLGNQVIPFIYDEAGYFSEQLAWVIKNKKFGFIDKLGNQKIPLIYDSGGGFSDGLAFVEKNKKFGCINKNGDRIIPFEYDDFNVFSEGLAAVKKGEKWGFVDKIGNQIIPFIYDEAGNFSGGLVKVKKAGAWGYIDNRGNQILPFVYDIAKTFSNGSAIVRSVSDREWHLLKII